jgi:hypothetical protein
MGPPQLGKLKRNDSEADMMVPIRTIVLTIVLSAVLALALPPGAAIAGGDDYDAMNDQEGKGPAYFGFVRDTRGSPISDARVVLQPKNGEPLTLKSNVLGLYRSHVSKDVRPDDVQVSCEKDGYKQSRVLRRTAAGGAHIETNCTMQRL